MKTDHVNCPIRPRVTLDHPDEPLEMIGFTIARYKFACKWMREGDRVMEAGCGAGFGCNFLSRHVKEVVGLDIDPKVIAECSAKYQRPNLRFIEGDIVNPRTPPVGRFDVVVSFEMIEHVSHADGKKMVANCAAHLKSVGGEPGRPGPGGSGAASGGGLFIMSTPRAREDRSVSRKAMHVFEYDYATLVATLDPHFRRVMIFCQNDEYIYAGHPSTAWNYVAVCFK